MKQDQFLQRKTRVRAKIAGTADRPRLSVFRSNKFISAQIINDLSAKTLVMASEKDLGKGKHSKTERAILVGESLAKKALAKKIKKVVFDKGGYKYHGRIKALAEAVRKGGIEF